MGEVMWLCEGSEQVETSTVLCLPPPPLSNTHSSRPHPSPFLFLTHTHTPATLWFQLTFSSLPSPFLEVSLQLYPLPSLPSQIPRAVLLCQSFIALPLVKPQEYSVAATQLGKLQPRQPGPAAGSPFPSLAAPMWRDFSHQVLFSLSLPVFARSATDLI